MEELPPAQLHADVERAVLIDCAVEVLKSLPTDELQSAVEGLAGPETVAAALAARRQRAAESHAWLEQELTRARAEDPHGCAKADAWARRCLGLDPLPDDEPLLREVDDETAAKRPS